MRARDFLILMLVCLGWGYFNVLSRTVVGDWQVLPLFSPRSPWSFR
jgi:O-acetylserine/cysteine efflux transporter